MGWPIDSTILSVFWGRGCGARRGSGSTVPSIFGLKSSAPDTQIGMNLMVYIKSLGLTIARTKTIVQ